VNGINQISEVTGMTTGHTGSAAAHRGAQPREGINPLLDRKKARFHTGKFTKMKNKNYIN
jgi:hypothetical protein